MGDGTGIEWTHATWNPVTGCTKVSEGCRHCYAERFAERFRGVEDHPYEQGFDLKLWPERLDLPLRWEKPRLIFVNSMSDLFHEEVPDSFIQDVYEVMNEATDHIFQILTKRPGRMVEISDDVEWTENIWAGISIENMDVSHRVDSLRETPSEIRFLSCEPLLGSLEGLDLTGIDWVIVGGESGPGARPMKKEWVVEIREKCEQESIPFFFKQWGGTAPGKGGRELDGQLWEEFPEVNHEGVERAYASAAL